MDTFVRFDGNPIISPQFESTWRVRGTFNPAAIYLEGKVHLIYRAQDDQGTSVLGYACSEDGVHISENLEQPIYIPRQSFEQKTKPNWNSGCEDPRITLIDDRLYMTYTAYDGTNPPRVALTSISLSDFLSRNWNWDVPKLISPPGIDDKDACIIKKVKGDGYLAFHRHENNIWLDNLSDITFPNENYVSGSILASSRPDHWDNIKIGIASPPIPIDSGWLLFYHGVSDPGFVYKIGAMLLDYENPWNVLARTDDPLLSPEKDYETHGQVPNVIYPCGAVILNDTVYLYYGGGDMVTAVATMPIDHLLNILRH